MMAILRFSLIFFICVLACHGQYLGRTVRTYMPAPVEPCFGSPGGYSSPGPKPDDLSLLLNLARLLESNQNQNIQPCGCSKSDINTEEIIHKLIDALLYATTNNNGVRNTGYDSTVAAVDTSSSYSTTGSQAQGVVPGLLEGLLGGSGQSGFSSNDGLVIQLLQSLLGGGVNQGAVTGLLGSSGANQGPVPNSQHDVNGANGGLSTGIGGLVEGLLGGGSGVSNGGSTEGLVGGGSLVGGSSGFSVGGLVGSSSSVGALASGGPPVGAIVGGGSPVGALVGGGSPVGALVGKSSPVEALMSDGSPVEGLVGDDSPLGVLDGGDSSLTSAASSATSSVTSVSS